jgi:HEPN domain-containing protein
MDLSTVKFTYPALIVTHILAQELENIIVNYSRLHYPRLNEYPYAPSELYTTENAVKTIELATKIIEIVDDTYFSN